MDLNWAMIFGGLGAILLELLLGVGTGFDLFLVGVALVLGGGIGNYFGSWQLGALISLTVFILYIIFGRRALKKRLTETHTATNTDRLLGRTGVVTKHNQVKVDNEIWLFSSDEELSVGEKVKVVSVEGVTLKVVKSKS